MSRPAGRGQDVVLENQAERRIQRVEILCVGTEILMGQIVNSNASNLARKLADLGIGSYYQTVVGDHPGRMAAAMREGLGRSDAVIVTGGLGPTEDDLSMEVAAQVAGQAMVLDDETWETIQQYFTGQGREVPAMNRKQALRPERATSLPNHNGTAPGAIIPVDWEGEAPRYLILLPGPPRENIPMFDDYVKPFLDDHREGSLRTLFIQFEGIGESEVAERLEDLIHEQSNPTLALYASEGQVSLRVTQSIASPEDPDLIADILATVQERLGDHIFELGQRDIFQVLLDLLEARGETLSAAESCTGGEVLSSFIDKPGASAVIQGGLVTYSNEAKMVQLGISPELLEEHGAVSEACVRQMAEACRERFGTDYALAISGIAGPAGGSEEKPVGTTYLAVAGPSGTVASGHLYRGNRSKIRRRAAVGAASLLWSMLRDQGLLLDQDYRGKSAADASERQGAGH